LLVDVVGAENVALGLDSNLKRVAELMKGEKFTPETAFHMETTLGLPHGFFDDPNPVLGPEIVARLRSPLDFVQTDVDLEMVSSMTERDFVPTVSQKSSLNNRLREEPEMAKKTTGASPRAVVRSSAGNSPKDRPGNAKISPQSSEQQSLRLDGSAAVETIRRANLHVLTTRNGSKVKLGAIMALTGSNMAHRLHGKKRMDDAEAKRFTERLGLPTGWLDTPRSEADIPESVSDMLRPISRGKASQAQLPAATAAKKDAGANVDLGIVRTARVPMITPVDENLHAPTGAAIEEAIAVIERGRASKTATEFANPPSAESDASFQTGLESLPDAAAPLARSFPRSFRSVTTLDNLNGIEPIVEALIKTLAGKARTGRLNELKALELLQQAVVALNRYSVQLAHASAQACHAKALEEHVAQDPMRHFPPRFFARPVGSVEGYPRRQGYMS